MNNHTKKIALSWSGGKDAALSYQVLKQQSKYEVVALLCTFHQTTERSSMHGHSYDLIKAQADQMNISLFDIWIPETGMESYDNAMQNGLERLKSEFRVEGVAFGDLFLEDIKSYREEKMKNTGLDCIFPIWQIPTNEAAEMIINNNIHSKICCVTSPLLNKSLIAKNYGRDFLQKLPESIDPCGENGEFHSFVHQAPFFDENLAISCSKPFFKPVDTQFQKKHQIEGHWFTSITLQNA